MGRWVDRDIVKEKRYVHGSAVYRQYKKTFEKMQNPSLFYEGSVRWKGSESFKEFSIIEDLMAK